MTFYRNGVRSVFESVADVIIAIEAAENFDVHTVTLVLNGQHGEFDLTVEATDQDLEDHRWTGIAHRTGGVSDFQKEE